VHITPAVRCKPTGRRRKKGVDAMGAEDWAISLAGDEWILGAGESTAAGTGEAAAAAPPSERRVLLGGGTEF